MRRRTGRSLRASNGGSATDRNLRIWTDRRDGTIWSVQAFWSLDELMIAQLVFESTEEIHETWWVSQRSLPHLTEHQLENLLDEARTG